MKHDKIARMMEYLAVIGEDVAPVSNARVVACVMYKKKMISIGISQYKTHPFQKEYGKNEHAIYLHAEVDAINKAKKILSGVELKKATLIICRPKVDYIEHEPTYGIAKPCNGCQKCIDDHGIPTVIYSNDSPVGTLSYTYVGTKSGFRR